MDVGVDRGVAGGVGAGVKWVWTRMWTGVWPGSVGVESRVDVGVGVGVGVDSSVDRGVAGCGRGHGHACLTSFRRPLLSTGSCPPDREPQTDTGRGPESELRAKSLPHNWGRPAGAVGSVSLAGVLSQVRAPRPHCLLCLCLLGFSSRLSVALRGHLSILNKVPCR